MANSGFNYYKIDDVLEFELDSSEGYFFTVLPNSFPIDEIVNNYKPTFLSLNMILQDSPITPVNCILFSTKLEPTTPILYGIFCTPSFIFNCVIAKEEGSTIITLRGFGS